MGVSLMDHCCLDLSAFRTLVSISHRPWCWTLNPKQPVTDGPAFPRAHGQERGLMTAWVVMRHRSKLDQLRALRTRAAPLTSSAGRGRRAAKGGQATLTNSSCLFSHLLSFLLLFPFGHSEPYSKVTTCRTASFRLATLTTAFKAVPKAGTRSQHAGSTPRESLGLTHCPPPPLQINKEEAGSERTRLCPKPHRQ